MVLRRFEIRPWPTDESAECCNQSSFSGAVEAKSKDFVFGSCAGGGTKVWKFPNGLCDPTTAKSGSSALQTVYRATSQTREVGAPQSKSVSSVDEKAIYLRGKDVAHPASLRVGMTTLEVCGSFAAFPPFASR